MRIARTETGLKKAENHPMVFTIFGVTGDLSEKKLLPALYDLFKRGLLPETFRLVGFSRRELSDADFQDRVRQAVLGDKHEHAENQVSQFIKSASYVAGSFDEDESYHQLKDHLEKIDSELGQCTNKLFHFAVPPKYYEIIFARTNHVGLQKLCDQDEGWVRILVEKPFGRDIKTARALDRQLSQILNEEQIFRIDHYLAKETLENILVFRFANSTFEPIWNKDHIEKVEIRLLESKTVAGREKFYDGIGALRDVGKNHVLQMLALIAMNDPKEFTAEDIRRERAEIFKELQPVDLKNLADQVIRGQYDSYRDENGVESGSETETYFQLKAFVNNKRWQGVPFYLESGKGLSESRVEIDVYFKKMISCVCPEDQEVHPQNRIRFYIQPRQGIAMRFWRKKPGFELEVEPEELDFYYDQVDDPRQIPDAYQRVLYDAIRGDQALFTDSEEIEASWKFIEPILNNWDELPLRQYKLGSEEPFGKLITNN